VVVQQLALVNYRAALIIFLVAVVVALYLAAQEAQEDWVAEELEREDLPLNQQRLELLILAVVAVVVGLVAVVELHLDSQAVQVL
jgi:branched-subunit amino acid permease